MSSRNVGVFCVSYKKEKQISNLYTFVRSSTARFKQTVSLLGSSRFTNLQVELVTVSPSPSTRTKLAC